MDILMNDISEDCRCGFEMSDKFREFFGDMDIPSGIPALKNSNADMIFSNFLKTDDGTFCIDYEWFFDFPVPEDYIRYRVYRCAFESYINIAWKIRTRQEFAVLLGIDEKLADIFDLMEDRFQQRISGDGLSAGTISAYNKPFRRLDEFAAEREGLIARMESAESESRRLSAEMAEKDRIIKEQQAYIEKLKRAIKNPLFAVKWAANKARKHRK